MPAKRNIDFAGYKLSALKSIDFSDFSELTIASGAITVTQACHTVDTQGDAASDDLDTISGGTNGMLLVLRAESDARTVVVKHNTGNIWLQGKTDINLDDIRDGLLLVYDGTKWFDIAAGGGGGGGSGDMLKATYDADNDGVVDDSEKLEGSTKSQVQDHAPKAHTHPVAELTDHNKSVHDALAINADLLDSLEAAAFALSGHTHAQLHDRSHDVESSSDHSASSKKGLFLKTNASTGAIEVVAHGLSYGDVGAEASGAVATHSGLTTGVHGVGAGTVAKVSDIATDGNLSSAAQDAVSKRHTQAHLITSTSDHTPTGLTASQLLRLNAGATAIESSGKTISDFPLSQAPDYIIEKIDATYYARPAPNSGLTSYSDASPLVVLQAAHDALPATGGVIHLKDGVSAVGLFTISKNNVTIKSDRKQQGPDGGIGEATFPYIRQVKIDASASDISGVLFEGIRMLELHFYCDNGYSIFGCDFTRCSIHKDETYHGIIFEGDGTATGIPWNIHFNNCVLAHIAGTDGATYGLINFKTSQWTSMIGFHSCRFCAFNSNQVFFECDGDALVTGLFIDGTSYFYTDTGTTGVKLFYQKTPTIFTQGVGFAEVIFQGNFLYLLTPFTITHVAEIASPHSNTLFSLIMNNNIISVDTGHTCTLMQSDSSDWLDNNGCLVFTNNTGPLNGGTFSLGTLPVTSSLRRVIRNNDPELYQTENDLAKRVIKVKVIDDATALTTGDGKACVRIPSPLTGMNLVGVEAHVYTVSSSGTPTVMVYNLTDSVEMLSVGTTIDANELDSSTAATPPTIDVTKDDVATGDVLRIDVDVAGTGTKGLEVDLIFQLNDG